MLRRIEPQQAQAWRMDHGGEPMETFDFEGMTLRRQPPVPVFYCKVPHSGRASASCCYGNQACTTGSNKCLACCYRYCDGHFVPHVKAIYVPVDTWRAFRRGLWEALKAIAESGKRRTPIKLSKPEVHAAEALEG